MSVIGSSILAGASGAAGGGAKTYVDDVFSTYLFDATAQPNNPVVNGIDLDTEGGLVWIKSRTTNDLHNLIDTERTKTKILHTTRTGAESTSTNGITSFNSNGFTLGNDADGYGNNSPSGADMVSWTFRKAPGFFDVVTYSGTGSARTIAHSLGSVPGMIIVKVTSGGSDDWFVYHRSLGDQRIKLNSTNASGSTAVWNYTAPTSSVFSVGTDGGVNGAGRTYVAYVFAHDDAQFGTGEDESIIKCGTYAGTNAENIINVGFEPQYFFIKRTDSAGLWMCWDFMRGAANNSINQPSLYFSSVDAESPFGQAYVHQNGFAFSNSDTDFNVSGGTYIYMAIRRPNKPPEAGTDVFAIDTRAGTSPTPPTFYSGFPVDLSLRRDTTADDWQTRSRLTGSEKMLYTNSNAGETNNSSSTVTFDRIDGTGFNTGADSANYSWMFKRAPGFMDVVAYKGTGSAQAINHNLGVVPELMLVKCKSHSDSWMVYANGVGPTKTLKLNNEGAAGTFSNRWNGAPTSSVINISTDTSVGSSGRTYIAYLFATLSDISKVGTYSGYTSNAVNVNCGFTAGARFILIKRTDADADWYVWDTTRGIVSGDDPYFLMNDSAAQVTNTDYIDPLTTGFTVTASAPAALNATGGTYLFLAIA